MARYEFENPPQTDATGGDPGTGDVWSKAFENTRLANYNQVMAAVGADVDFLFAQLGADTPDNVSFQYKDSATVTVSAGIAGQHTIQNATDMDFSGATASLLYYVWVGEDSVNGSTVLKTGTSATTPPAGLVSETAHRLRWYVPIDGSGNVEPFWFPFGANVDDVVYTYKDAETITVQAGGRFTAHDGTLYRVETDMDVTVSGDRSADAGAEGSNMMYALWGGENSSGVLQFYFHSSFTVLPSELVRGRLLRGGVHNDNASNLLDFRMVGDWMEYTVDMALDGNDATEIYDDTLNASTWVDLDFSLFLPPGPREIQFDFFNNSGSDLFFRNDGSSLSTGYKYSSYLQKTIHMCVGTNGIIEAKQNVTYAVKVSLSAYHLLRRR